MNVLALFRVLFLLLAPAVGWSCSCASDGTTEDERVVQAKYIYLGRVVSIDPATEKPIHGQYTTFRVRIVVLEVWKGTVPKTVIGWMQDVFNDPLELTEIVSSCSPPLGTEGVVVVLTDESEPTISPCSRNVLWIDEDETSVTRDWIQTKLDAR